MNTEQLPRKTAESLPSKNMSSVVGKDHFLKQKTSDFSPNSRKSHFSTGPRADSSSTRYHFESILFKHRFQPLPTAKNGIYLLLKLLHNYPQPREWAFRAGSFCKQENYMCRWEISVPAHAAGPVTPQTVHQTPQGALISQLHICGKLPLYLQKQKTFHISHSGRILSVSNRSFSRRLCCHLLRSLSLHVPLKLLKIAFSSPPVMSPSEGKGLFFPPAAPAPASPPPCDAKIGFKREKPEQPVPIQGRHGSSWLQLTQYIYKKKSIECLSWKLQLCGSLCL